MPSVDQRVFYRLAIELPVSYQMLLASATAGSREGSTINLSAGGMLLRTHQPEDTVVDELMEDSTRVEVALDLPDERLNILSRVVWLEPTEHGRDDCQMGLRFLDLDSSTQERIWRFVLEHKR